MGYEKMIQSIIIEHMPHKHRIRRSIPFSVFEPSCSAHPVGSLPTLHIRVPCVPFALQLALQAALRMARGFFARVPFVPFVPLLIHLFSFY